LIGIGWELKNLDGPHEVRAPDYDDWSSEVEDAGKKYRGLNGDILVWNSVLGRRHELSSMGIRVSKDNLLLQLEKTGFMERKDLYFHRRLLNDELPLTIGGGLGVSRVVQYLLQKKHIGEVSCSVWPESDLQEAEESGVKIL